MMKLVNDKLDSHNGSIWKEHTGTGHVLFDPNTVEDKRASDYGATGEEGMKTDCSLPCSLPCE